MASEDRQVKPWREVTRHEITAIKKRKMPVLYVCWHLTWECILRGSREVLL